MANRSTTSTPAFADAVERGYVWHGDGPVVGAGLAVLLDMTLVRGVLLPAGMAAARPAGVVVTSATAPAARMHRAYRE